jgi:RNase P/RNase MRP subunit p30
MITKEKNFNKLKELAKKQKLVFTSDDDDLNRKVIEKLGVETLLINQKQRKDRQKQRDSGFNQVLAKICKKNKIQIGINLDEIIESNSKQKAQILARVRQNIRLCNKNKLKMKFIAQNPKNNRDIRDLKALGTVLGMPTQMVKHV